MVENNTKKQAGLFRVGGVVSLLLVLVLSVATLGKEEIKNPNVITYLMPYDITTLDPAFSYWGQDQVVIQNVYETLIRYPLGIVDGDECRPESAGTSKFVPMLATVVPTRENGLVRDKRDGGVDYVFPIRSGVRFHNGGLLTPEDVEYSFERAMIQDSQGPAWMLFESLLSVSSMAELADQLGDTAACAKVKAAIEVKGQDVIFHLPAVYPGFLGILSFPGPCGWILDREWAIDQGAWDGNCKNWRDYTRPETEESPLYSLANGTGPFTFAEWKKDEQIILVRNNAYWDQPANIERIIVRVVEDWEMRKSLLESGDTDIVVALQSSLPELKTMEGVSVWTGLPTVQMNPVAFFTTDLEMESNDYVGTGNLEERGIPSDFFNDIRVRKAFCYAFDYEKFIEEACNGSAVMSHGPVPQALSLFYNPQQSLYSLNLRRAEQLLKEAHDGKLWEKGFTFRIPYTASIYRTTAAKILKDNIESINPKFHIELRKVDWSNYLDNIRHNRIPLWMLGWIADYADPHNFVQPFMSSTGVYLGWQGETMIGLAKSKYDPLIEMASKTTNVTLRQQLYYELERYAHDDALDIFLPQPQGHRVVRSWVQGLPFHPMMTEPYFYGAYKALPTESVTPNLPPTARFTFSPSSPKVGESVRFDASASVDPDGTSISYTWNFGDSTTGSGQFVTHAYDHKGTFTTTLIVTDDDGASASTSQKIEIANQSPQAGFSFIPSNPSILDAVQFTDSSTDPDGDIVSWEWNFDDGTTSPEPNPIHRYEREGTFTVTLTVTDNDGLTDETSQTIAIEHKDLIQANFTFHAVDEVLHKIHLDASASIDTMGTIVRYEWDWDSDGIYDTAVQTPEMTHRFDAEGPYQVILTIVDDKGNRASCTKEVAP